MLAGYSRQQQKEFTPTQCAYGEVRGSMLKNTYAYTYGKRPHAVTKIEPINNNVISDNICEVTYNMFNQPSEIKEGNYRLELSYGADLQRNKAVRYHLSKNTRYYISQYYEKEILSEYDTVYYHYIYGDNGLVGLHIAEHSGVVERGEQGEKPGRVMTCTDSLYYVYTDHLGSVCVMVNVAKKVRRRTWFDPWGNLVSGNLSLTPRGFTGHEHYPFFKIINMNGRLYDPVIGRFFSPDNFVQAPEFTQSYNRYSYCLNNPLICRSERDAVG